MNGERSDILVSLRYYSFHSYFDCYFSVFIFNFSYSFNIFVVYVSHFIGLSFMRLYCKHIKLN